VVKQPDWAEGVVDVVNLKSRVYSRWVNGNENFYYRGDAHALNEALRRYAAVKDDVRQVILLPGAGKTQSFNQTAIAFDWELHVPSGIYKAFSKRRHAVLTIHVNSLKPKPVDEKQVDRWLRDLDSDTFAIRDKAMQELEKLGSGTKPFLRQALRGQPQPSLEMRRRVEALLEKLRGLDVSDLEIPKGVTVLSADDLLTVRLKELKDADREVRTMAIYDLFTLDPYGDKVVPTVVGLLEQDPDAHLRRMAAVYLAELGTRGRPAVPALKKGLEDADANVRESCKRAIERIDNAKDDPAAEERRRKEQAISKDINAFVRTLGK
jgi:hypothetical protein